MSFRKIAAVVVACAALALGYSLPSALANQAPATSYCTAPNILYSSPPREISATPLDTNFAHAEVCGGQYGDWLTDGPIYPITISFSGSSFNFNIPQNDWVVKGQRIANALVSETAATSNTTYCYINWVTSAWTCNLSSSPPNSFSILGYTVVANGSGITSITNATPAAALFNSITDSSLIGNDGCLNVTSGVIGSTGTACGSGSGGGAVVAGNCLSATPTASPTGATLVAYTCATPTTAPSPTASNGPTSGPGQCTFTGINLNCLFPATSSPVPSPTSSNTAGPCDTLTNTGFSFLLTGNGTCTGGGTPPPCSTTATPPAVPVCLQVLPNLTGTPQPSIQPGVLGAKAIFFGPAPSPSATANYIAWPAGASGCGTGNPSGYAALGTNSDVALFEATGVNGSLATFWCYNTADSPAILTINAGEYGQRCCLGVDGGVYSNGGYTVDHSSSSATGSTGFTWLTTEPYGCGFTSHGVNEFMFYFDAYPATPSPDSCILNVNSLSLPSVGASNTVCTDASSVVSPCPSPAGGSVTSVVATPTACAAPPVAVPTSGAVIVYVPWTSSGCGGGSGTPTPNPYNATVLAETSATHFWEMGDSPGGATPGPCPSTAADSIGGGATAAPSPEVATVIASPLPHPSGSPLALQCGLPGPIKNGQTAMEWLGPATAAAYLKIPSPAFQTLCNPSGGSCDQAFTVECIVAPGNASAIGTQLTQGYAYIWSIDTSASHGAMYLTEAGSGDLAMIEAAPGTQQFGLPSSGMPVMLDYEFDGTSESYYFINGTLAGYATETPSKNNADLSFFGWDGTSANRFWNGRMQGCSTYNTALTIQQIRVHYAATGLP